MSPSRRRSDTIRVVALAVAIHANRAFLFEGQDPASGEVFYRPIGAAVQFGQRAMTAARRAVERDMSTEFLGARQLDVLENVYERGGETQHEICFCFAGAFADRQVYEHETVELTEGDDTVALGGWHDIAELAAPGAPRVYPEGLLPVIQASQRPTTAY